MRSAPASLSRTLIAPTKGWYVGANLAAARPGTAYILDNAFPQLDYVRARRGSVPWATGMTGFTKVPSLMTWTNGLSSKMFAVTNGRIFDVSAPGAVGAAAVAGLSSSDFEHIQFTGTGGTFLIAVNGIDPAQIYNGAAWGTTPAITGLTGNPLVQLWVYNSRIYGIERDSLNAWYLPVDSIGGAATKLPLASIFKFGGSLVCGGSWSIQSNVGVFDATVFISSEGEVAMYSGDYPGALNWSIKGVYKISKPLGRRCLMKAGGDLAIVTEDGIVPMSRVQSLDQEALQNVAVTVPIAPAWRQAVIDRTGLSGWQIVTWPLESMGIINLPKLTSDDKTQYIANVRTGAWARYLGWDANCFAVFNNKLYYGTSDGRVMQAEVGGKDDGQNYTVTIFPSFTDLGAGPYRKHIKMVRPMLQANSVVTPKITIRVDYDITVPNPPSISTSPGSGPIWDSTFIWDVSLWPSELSTQNNWHYSTGFGSVISPVLQVTIGNDQAPDIRLTAIDLVYEKGSIIG